MNFSKFEFVASHNSTIKRGYLGSKAKPNSKTWIFPNHESNYLLSSILLDETFIFSSRLISSILLNQSIIYTLPAPIGNQKVPVSWFLSKLDIDCNFFDKSKRLWKDNSYTYYTWFHRSLKSVNISPEYKPIEERHFSYHVEILQSMYIHMYTIYVESSKYP